MHETKTIGLAEDANLVRSMALMQLDMHRTMAEVAATRAWAYRTAAYVESGNAARTLYVGLADAEDKLVQYHEACAEGFRKGLGL